MSDGTNIKIDTKKMMSVARVIDQQMNIITSCLDSIRRDALGLRTNNLWQGESADAYYDSMAKLCSDQQQSGAVNAASVVGILREYSLDLNRIAAEFDRTEVNVTAKNEALPSDVFGV